MIFKRCDILIPEFSSDSDLMNKWSVVACDQYTQDFDYWNNTYKHIGDAKSTINIIVPEIYLGDENIDKRIYEVNDVMEQYIADGTLKEFKNTLIYVERQQKNGAIRHGIVGCVDLEEYDYTVGSKSKIRATEGTVLDRIPPRLKVRSDAVIESPHIMMLIDDESKSIIECLSSEKDKFEIIYNFKLNNDSGHITGYKLTEKFCDIIESKLKTLDNIYEFNNKYNCNEKSPLVFAVGDGNHSLATAKAHYEKLKQKEGERALLSPARYALCELVNLHDDSLVFEPIHRVVINASYDEFFKELSSYYDITVNGNSDGQKFVLINGQNKVDITVNNPTEFLTVGTVQQFLDYYCKKHNAQVDYIHGEHDVIKLTKNPNNIGIILDVMSKNNLYKSVIECGALPRKTFSMGEAYDKRFYIECRKIK